MAKKKKKVKAETQSSAEARSTHRSGLMPAQEWYLDEVKNLQNILKDKDLMEVEVLFDRVAGRFGYKVIIDARSEDDGITFLTKLYEEGAIIRQLNENFFRDAETEASQKAFNCFDSIDLNK